MASRLHSRLDRIAADRPSSMSLDAQRLLVSLLGRRDALFWPWRCVGPHRAAIASVQRDYLTGRAGIAARGQGSANWKSAHNTRNQLIAAGQCRATVSGGQCTGLLLTPRGEADARALVGDRLSVGELSDALIERITERSDRFFLGRHWCSESALFDVEIVGDPAEWQHLTEVVLPLLTAGVVVANCDSIGRVYYSVDDDVEMPQPIRSEFDAVDDFDAVYLKSFDAERIELQRTDDTNCEIVVPISCTK